VVQAVAGSSPVAHLNRKAAYQAGSVPSGGCARPSGEAAKSGLSPIPSPNPRAARGLLADAPPSERERYRRPGASLRAADGIRTHDLLHGKQTGGRIGTAGGAPEAARSGKPLGLVGVHFGCVWDNDWDNRSLSQGDGFVALKARKTSLLADETGTGADGFTHRATGGRTRRGSAAITPASMAVVNDASWSSRASSRCPRRQPPRSPRRSQIGQPRSPRDRGGLGLASYGGRQRW
jgi:hypothetical protein